MELLFLWAISPLILLPILIHFQNSSRRFEDENRKLKKKIESLKRDNAYLQKVLTYCSENDLVPNKVEQATSTEHSVYAEVILPESVHAEPGQGERVPVESIQGESIQAEPEPVQAFGTVFATSNQPAEALSKIEKTETANTNSAPVKAKKEAPNRGTVLFGIGVFFVLLAGVIFATTTWKDLSSFGKVVTLLAAVVVFYISSFIAKEKLNLRETGITFFLLGSGFLSAINLSIGYFEWFSESYSFNGTTGYLVAGISMVILIICLIVGEKLYDMPSLGMASEILSVADVPILSLFFTDNFGIVMLISGLYLWILFGFLFFYEYRRGKNFLLKALIIISYLYIGLTIVAIFAADFVWACVISVVALLMFIPQIYMDEKKRNITVRLFDACFVLFAVFLAFRIKNDFDIRVAAVFVVMAMIVELLFVTVKLPVIGTLKNRISDWSSFAILIIGFIFTVYEGSVEYEKDALIMHTIHVYAALAVHVAILLYEILKSRESFEADKICLYCKLLLILVEAGWVNKEYYGIENLIAFAIVIGLYFVWKQKLKKQDEQKLAILLAVVSTICGIVATVVCVENSKLAEEILVAILLAVLYVFLEKEKKFIPAGLVIATLYTDLSNMVYEFSASANTDSNILRAHILLVFIIVGMVVGRVRYKMLRDTREGHEGIDFIGAGTIIFAAACGGFNEYLGIFSIALYLAYYFRRTRNDVWRVLVGISAVLFGYLLYAQPFVEIPKTIDKEYIVVAVSIVLLLEGFIWKEHTKIYSYVSSIAIIIVMLVYAMEKRSVLYYADGGLVADAIGMISFFLVISAIIWGIGFVLKNRIYNIAAGALLIVSSIMTGALRSPLIGIIVLCIGALYGLYLFKKREEILLFLPLSQLYCFLLIHKPMPQLVWIAVFIISLGVGQLYYTRIYTITKEEKRADWFTILSVISALVILTSGNDKWVFCGEMMFAIYVLCFYRRVEKEIANKVILSIVSVVIAIALISQPFFEISKDWYTEWILAIIWSTILINSQIIYNNSKEDFKYILMFIAAIISVMWQGIEAIESERPAEAIILGVCMAALLLYSFYAKKEMWLFLSAITLVVQGIYATRAFWKSLEWWIYMLAVGVIFITVAARNEYNKHYSDEKEKRKLFTDWSVW